MRIVVALGGNALLRRGERPEAAVQQAHVSDAAAALATLADDHELVVTHGNGPQVGLLALEGDAYREVAPYPFDVLGAESQGMIGYLLAQGLSQTLPERNAVVVLTRVVVDPDDAGFRAPTKPIGPVYFEEQARQLARERGWTVARDGNGYRRVVASPDPHEIVELGAIERLLSVGAVVVCAGGGGVPVVRAGGGLHGVEAVIDKDLTAALLAESLGADRLVILTDVSRVEREWGTRTAEPISHTTPAELRRERFAAGSMGPKVEAACRFVERTGCVAAIGALEELADVAHGYAGTQVAPRAAGWASVGARIGATRE
jgi:carbamate kinase